MVKTYKFKEESKIVAFRVPKSHASEYREAIKEFINTMYFEKVNDIRLLRKLVPYFIKQKVKVNLEDIEFNRIKKIWEEVKE